MGRGLDTRFKNIGKVIIDCVPEDHADLIQYTGRACRTVKGIAESALILHEDETTCKSADSYVRVMITKATD